MPEKIVSHYRVLEKLGEGGMAKVFKAHDLILDRPVALKFLSGRFAGTSEGSERFLREARAASALNHPNIVTIYEIGDHEGSTFIASEYIEGDTLRSLVTHGGAAIDDIVRSAVQVAEGLRLAHQRGIVHRDIKPENLMVTAEGRVKIMDFGIAGGNVAKPGQAREESVAGTLPYMSPEQVEGRPVDQRTDIFSLGVVLYELLTGLRPFTGEYDVAILYALLHVDPPPVESLRPDVPGPLRTVVARCLRKNPDERFQRCDEILAELTAARPVAQGRIPALPLSIPGTPLPDMEGATPLVGREREVEMLSETMTRVAAGRGQMMFLSGESGIGKTQLVLSTLREGRSRGLLPLWGRCLFQERGLPYHALAEALRGIFAVDGPALLDAVAKGAEARGIDVAGRRSSMQAFLRLTPDSVSLQNKEQLWDTVLVLLRALASERPLLFVLDDLQWADRETIALLSFLARSTVRDPVMLIGAYRNEKLPSEQAPDLSLLQDSIRQLRREGIAEEIALLRLTEAQTGNVLGQALGGTGIDPPLARLVFKATQGNPLFISELAGLMKAKGSVEQAENRWRMRGGTDLVEIPERVHDVIAQRLAGLEGGHREILEIASCDGDHFDSDTVAACLQADRLSVLRSLQAIEKTHALVHHESSRYVFDHPLIRQVLYEGIIPELREEYHRLIADRLLSRTQGEPALAARIAHHLLRSSQETRATGYLLLAGDHARDLYAMDEAAGQYGRAAAILARDQGTLPATLVRLEEGVGDVTAARGNIREALAHYDSMLRQARAAGNDEKEIAALRKAADCCRILGESERGLIAATDAVNRARGTGQTRELARALNALAEIHTAGGEYEKTILRSQEALDIAQGLSDHRLAAVSLSGLGMAGMHTGDYRMALQRLGEAKSLQEYAGDRRGLAGTLNALALVTHRLARYEEALAHAEASLELKESIGDAAAIPGTLNIIGDVHRDSGNLPAALQYHTRSLAMAREQANQGSQCDNLRDLGADTLLAGEREQSRRFLDEVLSIARARGYLWYEARATITLSELLTADNALQEAEEVSRRGLDLARTLKAQELIAEALWKRARTLEKLARTGEAVALLEEAVTCSSRSGHRIFLWHIEYDLGRCLAAAGRAEDSSVALGNAGLHVREIADQFLDTAARERFLAWTAASRDRTAG